MIEIKHMSERNLKENKRMRKYGIKILDCKTKENEISENDKEQV